MNNHNIRTISLLDKIQELTSLIDLSSDNIVFEISKTEDNKTINTYKLSGKDFIELLINYINQLGDERWVTVKGDKQEINSPKKFNQTVEFGNDVKVDINNNQSTLSANTVIEGTARRAMWA